MKTLRNFRLYSIILAAFAFTSCSGELEIIANKAGSAEVNYKSAMGKALEHLVRSVSGLSDSTASNDVEQNIFDSVVIAEDLSAAGLKNVRVQTSKTSELKLAAIIPELTKGLEIVPEALHADSHSIVLTLSPEILQKILDNMSEDLQTYVDMLMAPIFTGEELSQTEYLELLASVYGPSISQEISTSTMKIKLALPSGKNQDFIFSLPELLTLTEEKQFKISE